MAAENPFDLNYLVSLYHGYGAIAERQFSIGYPPLHIDSLLQGRIKAWLQQKRDVILTGSPGDGKTHLMKVVLQEIGEDNVGIELDASQRTSDQLLNIWRGFRENGKPFLLAINHAPLRQLAEEAKKYPDFTFLHESILPNERNKSTIESFIIYSDKQRGEVDKEPPFILIDLSQRELLTDNTLLDGLLEKLSKIAEQANCNEHLSEGCQRCPIRYNARALADPNIQNNLKKILKLVTSRGFHATMRDLIGMFAFALTGGKICANLWIDREKRYDYWDYYNLLFAEEAHNGLLDALKKTFDPGEFADGKQDMALWTNQSQDGWWCPEEINQPPSNLEEMRSRKRRFFFEFIRDSVEEKLSRMLSSVEQEFDNLLSAQTDMNDVVQTLVERINLLYAPVSNSNGLQGYRTQLRLWNQHRYSIGPTAGYFAMRRISSEKLTIYHPELNPLYYSDNKPMMEIRRDHVLLAVDMWRPGDPALRIDWDMYQALAAAEQGRAIEVQPYHILRRLDLFLRSLSSELGRAYSEETIEWSDTRERRLVTVRVNRERLEYRKQGS